MSIATNLRRIQRQNRALLTTPDPGFFIGVGESDVRETREENHPSAFVNIVPFYQDLVGGAYCIAGALCRPPSNFAGRTENDAFPFTGPRLSASEPAVPACEDSTKPGSRAQHSRVDWLLRAPMTVTLRVLKLGAVGSVVAATAAVLVRRVARYLNETILLIWCGNGRNSIGDGSVGRKDQLSQRGINIAGLNLLVRHPSPDRTKRILQSLF